MADETQIVEDALDVLREITNTYPDEEVGLWAGSMQLLIRGPIINMVRRSGEQPTKEDLLREWQRALQTVPGEFVEAASKAAEKKRGPAYKTPVFKCLEDFEKCKKYSNPSLCLALMAVCVGKQLIPFTK
jgi:hypothetical protein